MAVRMFGGDNVFQSACAVTEWRQVPSWARAAGHVSDSQWPPHGGHWGGMRPAMELVDRPGRRNSLASGRVLGWEPAVVEADSGGVV